MTNDNGGLDELTSFVRSARSLDPSGYERATLRRRLQKRLRSLGLDTFACCREYLEEHPDEFERSFDAVLINVTECFRDAAAWQHLSRHVAPDLLAQSQDHETLRAWAPGCSSGEETYAVAMVLAEALGEDAVRSGMKIYGTDVDRDARTWPGHTVDRHGTVTPVDGRDDLPRGATVVTAVTDAHGDT